MLLKTNSFPCLCVCVTFSFPFLFVCLFCVCFCCCCCYFIIFTSSLTRLSCLPVTHENNFLLGDPPPGLTWRSPQLLQTPGTLCAWDPAAPLPLLFPQNLSARHPSLKPTPPPRVTQFPPPVPSEPSLQGVTRPSAQHFCSTGAGKEFGERTAN